MVLVHNEDTIRYTEIIGVDVERDIIILKLEGTDFRNIPLRSNSDNIKVGEKVYAIGSPWDQETCRKAS